MRVGGKRESGGGGGGDRGDDFTQRPPRTETPVDPRVERACAGPERPGVHRLLRTLRFPSRYFLRESLSPVVSVRGRLRVLCSLSAPVLIAAWWLSWPQQLSSHGTLTTTVLFDREIVRILNNHCVMCHGERSLSFPLSTYEQTWVRGRSIRDEVLRRHMPPWSAVPGYGEFLNDNSLTLREKQFVVSWVEGLGPRNAGTVFLNVGGAGGAPSTDVRAGAHPDHWQLGEPDLTRSVEQVIVAAHESDVVRRTTVDLGLASERRVRGLEFMPGDRRVVRAAVFTLESTGQWLGSWTPWHGFASLPPGAMYRLPAGARIVAEVHYRGTTERVEAGGTLGLFFADRTATRPAADMVLDAVPAGGGRRLRATARVTADTYAWALQPRIDPAITSIEVSARRPDGGTDVLLYARNLSSTWPTPYILRVPRLLRRGTDLSFVASFDPTTVSPPSARLTISRY